MSGVLVTVRDIYQNQPIVNPYPFGESAIFEGLDIGW